jgi:iron complex outermembrane receptor protein
MLALYQQLYVSRGRGLEFGSEAPLTAANAGNLLVPRLTKQSEIGWKGSHVGFGWSAALFQMERPYEYTQPVGSSWAGLGNYVSGGQQVHRGMDISWHTPENLVFRAEGSQAYIHARASGSGAFDGVQIQNVPRISSFVRATALVPGAPGLETYVDWIYRGERIARRNGAVSVPGYQLFNLGVTWRTQFVGQHVLAALAIRNVADRRYWRDVGEAYSADLLFPGEGRSVAASIRLDL